MPRGRPKRSVTFCQIFFRTAPITIYCNLHYAAVRRKNNARLLVRFFHIECMFLFKLNVRFFQVKCKILFNLDVRFFQVKCKIFKINVKISQVAWKIFSWEPAL